MALSSFEESLACELETTGLQDKFLDAQAVGLMARLRAEDNARYLLIKGQAGKAGIFGGDLERLLSSARGNSTEMVDDIMASDLMAKEFKPLTWFASGFLHEGMVLFGGKSKRGKSWVALNMALSIATGGKVFGEYEVGEPSKVLYCALEDGPRRTQRRLRLLDPEADLSNLKIAFKMPPLEDGGMEYITRHIEEGYGVIVIDVLAHVETAGKHGLRDYHEVYQTFAPLQELRNKHPFALVMITHLRKAESEEVFDNLHGSVAYQGAQDALWVMERKQGEDNALIHVRDKDAEDKTLELKFDGAGIWSFVGEGEEHQTDKLGDRVVRFLKEERRPLSINEILQGLELHKGNYGYLRKVLRQLIDNESIAKTSRGKYAAMVDFSDPEDEDL